LEIWRIIDEAPKEIHCCCRLGVDCTKEAQRFEEERGMELATTGWQVLARTKLSSQISRLVAKEVKCVKSFNGNTIVQEHLEQIRRKVGIQTCFWTDWSATACIMKLEELGDENRNRRHMDFQPYKAWLRPTQAHQCWTSQEHAIVCIRVVLDAAPKR
jgi:hypothetical protein